MPEHSTTGIAGRLVDEQLRRVSARATKSVARHYGRRLGMWQGCGYPKSGTVWLCQLLGSYLELPYPRRYRMPIAMASVIHTHWLPFPQLPPTMYIVRDGRDVMLSLYHYESRLASSTRNPSAARTRTERFRRVLGPRADLRDVSANLPRFIESQLESPSWVEAAWPQHVQAWLDVPRGMVAIVRYEDLRHDVGAALGPPLARLLGEPVDEQALQIAATRFGFARQQDRTKRPAEERAFLRQGEPGEWKTYFTAEACTIFDQAAAPVLDQLGYGTR
ncbi:MAG: sulfotransferase domain-containing protein [Sporichthyaceae bacterium]|nr:sulfotransferase domain-containing protein [Sporichthyaceae bacterium]